MLKGISPLLSPDLLKTLASMGHGDEIVLADAHFPGTNLNSNVLRADGIEIKNLLAAIMPLFELDMYVDYPLVMMKAVADDQLDPAVERSYLDAINPFCKNIPLIEKCERFKFYDRAKKAFAIVITGEMRAYGNIILKKGVIQH